LRLPLCEKWERNPAQGAPLRGARRIQALLSGGTSKAQSRRILDHLKSHPGDGGSSSGGGGGGPAPGSGSSSNGGPFPSSNPATGGGGGGAGVSAIFRAVESVALPSSSSSHARPDQYLSPDETARVSALLGTKGMSLGDIQSIDGRWAVVSKDSVSPAASATGGSPHQPE
jgi:hypothetical protein